MSDLNLPLRVIARRDEAKDTQSLFFAPPDELHYAPGDWLDIRFPTPEFPVGRTYSFASSPTEPVVQITFKHGVSPFKQQLRRARPGEVLLITQYGSNGFRLDRRHPAVFIAGGVGITPFRSMIKALIDTGATMEIDLVYQNRTDDVAFQGELDAWARDYPWFRPHYVVTAKHGRLTAHALRDLLPDRDRRQPKYYLAGPPGMVDQVEQLVQAMGADPDAIMTDRFTGY